MAFLDNPELLMMYAQTTGDVSIITTTTTTTKIASLPLSLSFLDDAAHTIPTSV